MEEIVKYLISESETNSIVKVKAILKIEFVDGKSHIINYNPKSIVFYLKENLQTSWNYSNKKEMLNEYNRIKKDLQKFIIENNCD